MSAKRNVPTSSVCLNHPERAADTRCCTCFKPICADCAVRAEGEDFCSPECRDNYQSTRPAIDEFQSREARRRSARRRRRLILLIVLAVAGYVAYRYFRENPDAVRELQQKGGEVIRKGKDLAK